MMKRRMVSLVLYFLILCLFLSAATSLSSCKGKAPKGELQKVDFVIDWKPSVDYGYIDYVGYYVAAELGYYKEEGIEINFKHLDGAPFSAELIGTGQSFIGATTADKLVIAKAGKDVSKKLPIKAVATVFSSNPVVIASISSKPIVRIEDMNGKRLGINRESVFFRQFELLASHKEKNLKDVKYVDVGWGGTEELLKGQIDALLAYTTGRPVHLELQLKKPGDPRVLRLPLKDVDRDFNIIGQVIAVYEPSLSDPNKLEQIKKIVRASLKGWAAVKKNPREALEIYLRKYPTTERYFAGKALEWTGTLVSDDVGSAKVREDEWEKTIKLMKAMNVIAADYMPKDFYSEVN
ncbi:MAG TPA: ABC transporter substrate-binding protein [Thermodesulfovibrionales bacterium]|nr:ABC transporter substrate-binding protein [Thermodesulfovibrionales bacterium]